MGDNHQPLDSRDEWRRALFIVLIIAMIAGAALVSFWLRP